MNYFEFKKASEKQKIRLDGRIFYFLITIDNQLCSKHLHRFCCYQSVKDRNFESNSQLMLFWFIPVSVVISLSKIEISKAIHNRYPLNRIRLVVVISLSKIEISKAIHNPCRSGSHPAPVVISLSKIEISKAIHNEVVNHSYGQDVVISLSKIEISKAIHNPLLRES